MRFTPLLGLAMVVATPLAATEPSSRNRELLGVPIIEKVIAMHCPETHRFEVVRASLTRAGWRQHGTSVPGPLVNHHPTVLTPWHRGHTTIWVRHGGTAACVTTSPP